MKYTDRSTIAIALAVSLFYVSCSSPSQKITYKAEKEMENYKTALNDLQNIGLNGYIGAHFKSYFLNKGKLLCFLASEGSPVQTGIDTNFAILGDGFFKVFDPGTSKTFFTRDGRFSYDSEGYLATLDGYRLLPLMKK